MSEKQKYIIRIEKQEISYVDLEVEIEGEEEEAQAHALEYIEKDNSIAWQLISSAVYCPNNKSENDCGCSDNNDF